MLNFKRLILVENFTFLPFFICGLEKFWNINIIKRLNQNIRSLVAQLVQFSPSTWESRVQFPAGIYIAFQNYIESRCLWKSNNPQISNRLTHKLMLQYNTESSKEAQNRGNLLRLSISQCHCQLAVSPLWESTWEKSLSHGVIVELYFRLAIYDFWTKKSAISKCFTQNIYCLPSSF